MHVCQFGAMTSFVTEILVTAGQMEKEEIRSQLEALAKRIDQTKMDIYELTANKYVDFCPTYDMTRDLTFRSKTVSSEIEAVKERIETEIRGQLNVSTGEFQFLKQSLQELTSVLAVLKAFVKLQDCFDEASSAIENKQYSKAAAALLSMKDLLSQPLHAKEHEIKIISALRTECMVQQQSLIALLSDLWKEDIVWAVSDVSPADLKWSELKLLTCGDNATILQEAVAAMNILGVLDPKIKAFSEKVLKYLITPALQKDCELKVKSSKQASTLHVALKGSEHHSADHETAFKNINSVLEFLSSSFMYMSTDNDKKSSVTLFEMLGREISATVVDMVVKNCLSMAIPSNSKDLDQFDSVVCKTEGFQKLLLDCNFLQKDNTALISYVQNVNVLFANKKCQDIIEQARALMTSEIHDTIALGEGKQHGELPQLDSGPKSKKTALEMCCEMELSEETFKLPRCRISLTINKVMELAYETLHEATGSSVQCAIQLFYAVRNMFEIFCSVFPIYHKHNLETLPQLAALHHNNCMFIAHHLMTLGHQFKSKLPPALNTTFLDMVPKIRRIGTESFIHQMNLQKEQLLEYLHGADGFANVADNERLFAVERAIKQVLHLLNHLQNVWQDVLPISVYRKAIGMLVNVFVEEITESIIALEDISSDDARQLSLILSGVVGKVGPMFDTTDEKASNADVELQRNVPNWRKFKELQLVINGSLHEIVDRWAEKKGPLADVFSANELKQLIRALFQNTDRRAAVLAKIR
ncbi:centromere/kinetochore protein zw10 homolog [Gigantopelta aegis]|uniref:centromere/kinetochore protein zw10 homolog n=1 Tax=Gigantopelta aegis TaxID=1735272 RepID=UPI001B8894C3|nr:centromere/kinetochore protein zw10 homolog [Gigantopelta aegis]